MRHEHALKSRAAIVESPIDLVEIARAADTGGDEHGGAILSDDQTRCDCLRRSSVPGCPRQ